MKDTALLLIDIQNDYFPGGRMELDGAVGAGNNAGKILSHCREANIPVVHIQHLSVRQGATFFIPGTEGAEINRSVTPMPGEKIMQKNFPNSFRQTGLAEYLEKLSIKKLLICGMMTHMCVDATVRAAFDSGYTCMVAADACAAKELVHGSTTISALHVHGAFLAALGSVYAEIQNTTEFIKRFN
jgi:nicotinamidase-related amidase